MSWKSASELSTNKLPEKWFVFGREKDGYETVKEGESIIGYLERMSHSEKHGSYIASLISENKDEKFLMFTPPNLKRQLEAVLENVGKSLVKITYEGRKEAVDLETNEPIVNEETGEVITYHSFKVEYDDTKRLEE